MTEKTTETKPRAHDDLPSSLLWLKEIPDSYRNQKSPASHVFIEEFDGARWFIATEGHVLVAVRAFPRDDVEKYEVENLLTQNAHKKNDAAFCEKFLTPTSEAHRNLIAASITVSYEVLKQWVDLSMYHECPLCRGTGVDPELDEVDTDARINEQYDPQYGRIGGQIISRALLVTAFSNLEAKSIKIDIPFEAKDAPLLFLPDGDEWRVLLMATEPDADTPYAIKAQFEVKA